MLANLRFLGHVFNPVCFYYCFEPEGERVEAIVADVNTFLGESVILMSCSVGIERERC